MFGIGTGELLLLLVIALIVLGPERMPKVARDLGRMVGDLRRTSEELREEFMNADKVIDLAAKQGQALGGVEGGSAPATREVGVAGDSPPARDGGSASVPPGHEGESAFDREMREARERIKGQQSS